MVIICWRSKLTDYEGRGEPISRAIAEAWLEQVKGNPDLEHWLEEVTDDPTN